MPRRKACEKAGTNSNSPRPRKAAGIGQQPPRHSARARAQAIANMVAAEVDTSRAPSAMPTPPMAPSSVAAPPQLPSTAPRGWKLFLRPLPPPLFGKHCTPGRSLSAQSVFPELATGPGTTASLVVFSSDTICQLPQLFSQSPISMPSMCTPLGFLLPISLQENICGKVC